MRLPRLLAHLSIDAWHKFAAQTRMMPPGQADLDDRKFLALAASRTPQAPLALAYVGGNDYGQSLDHLREMMPEVGPR